MPERGLLVDNDVFLILSGSGLLDEATDTLGFSRSSVFRLPSLLPMLRKGKTFAHYTPSVQAAALKQCASVAPVPHVPDPDLAQSLAAVREIDQGEALLFGVMAEQPHYLLTTHDKHALRSLSRTASVRHIRVAVAGRVICLETVLLELIERLGVASVAEALDPILANSTELRTVFTPGNVARPGECVGGLWSYQRQLEQEVGADLLWQSGAG